MQYAKCSCSTAASNYKSSARAASPRLLELCGPSQLVFSSTDVVRGVLSQGFRSFEVSKLISSNTDIQCTGLAGVSLCLETYRSQVVAICVLPQYHEHSYHSPGRWMPALSGQS